MMTLKEVNRLASKFAADTVKRFAYQGLRLSPIQIQCEIVRVFASDGSLGIAEACEAGLENALYLLGVPNVQ